MLCVTPQGERLLAQHDPMSGMANAIAALVADDCLKLRNALDAILNRIEAPRPHPNAGRCGDCIFLRRGDRAVKGRTNSEFRCRLYRAPLAADETELLCTGFEPAGRD
jgi:hypothetical protein